MTADPIIIHSPLEGRIVRDGQGVEVRIYKSPDTDWLLEVVDDFGNSTTWQDLFATDQEAYDALMEAIDDEGILSFIDRDSDAELQ